MIGKYSTENSKLGKRCIFLGHPVDLPIFEKNLHTILGLIYYFWPTPEGFFICQINTPATYICQLCFSIIEQILTRTDSPLNVN